MPVEEHYYILDATEDGRYVLYFYCGYGFNGEYQGALVYGRRDRIDDSKETYTHLPVEVEQRFAEALKQARLEKYVPVKLEQFCRPTYKEACENMLQ
jgi:hypothetical protein